MLKWSILSVLYLNEIRDRKNSEKLNLNCENSAEMIDWVKADSITVKIVKLLF